MTAARTQPGDPFPSDAEHRLGDFAALVAQAIVNAEARRETAELVEEQSALRRSRRWWPPGGRRAKCSTWSTRRSGRLFGATAVTLVRWTGVPDEVVIVAGWSEGDTPVAEPGALYHPDDRRRDAGRARDRLCDALGGVVARARALLRDRGAGDRPGSLLGALTASRPAGHVSGRRRDQAAELRRPRRTVDRERACTGRVAGVACADRPHGRRDARATRAEPARRRAAASRLRLDRAAPRDRQAPHSPTMRAPSSSAPPTSWPGPSRSCETSREGCTPSILTESGLGPATRGARSPRAGAGHRRERDRGTPAGVRRGGRVLHRGRVADQRREVCARPRR